MKQVQDVFSYHEYAMKSDLLSIWHPFRMVKNAVVHTCRNKYLLYWKNPFVGRHYCAWKRNSGIRLTWYVLIYSLINKENVLVRCCTP